MADNHVCFTIIHILQKKKSKKPKVFECTSITPPKITLSLSQEEESAKQRSTEATTHTHTHTQKVAERLREMLSERMMQKRDGLAQREWQPQHTLQAPEPHGGRINNHTPSQEIL